MALVWPLLGFWVALAPDSGPELGVLVELGVAAEAVVLCVDAPAELLASVGLLLPPPDDFPALAFTVSSSFTCLTPAMDFAMSRARFLSAFEATLPVSMAVPFVTETCTFENAGSWLNFA